MKQSIKFWSNFGGIAEKIWSNFKKTTEKLKKNFGINFEKLYIDLEKKKLFVFNLDNLEKRVNFSIAGEI